MYTREDFVIKFTPFAKRITRGTGILPGTLLSQAILESQGRGPDGNYYVGASKLSKVANNYFGIKADKSWTGRTYNIDTGEYTPKGEKVVISSDFRVYDSVKDSMRDYVKFLLENPRYRKAGVFEADTVADQAAALKRAGYATAPNYAGTVTSIYDGIKSYVEIGLKNYRKYVGYTAGFAVLTLALIGGAIYYSKQNSK